MGACKTFAKSGLGGECGAEYAMDLASRNDGYMVHASNNPTISALVKAGKITTTRVDDKYLIARVVKAPSQPYHHARREIPASPAAKIGQGNFAEETFA